jgi:hypothetical protein
MYIATCLLLGLTPLILRAGTIRDDRNPRDYLRLGASPDFASVGLIEGTDRDDEDFSASGTLVARNWVLTAAHVVEDADSLDFTIGGKTYSSIRNIAFPRWTGDLYDGYDIALVKLDSPVKGIVPARRYAQRDERGSVATIAGFGDTGTGKTGDTGRYDGRKRAGQNVLDVLEGDNRKTSRLMMIDFDSPRNWRDSSYGSSTPLNLEYLIAAGDSGGGVFIDDGHGPALAGVTSFDASFDGDTDASYGDTAGFTRVSVFNRWIDNVIGGADLAFAASRVNSIFDSGKTSASSKAKASVAPEPGAAGALLTTSLLLFRRRATRRS